MSTEVIAILIGLGLTGVATFLKKATWARWVKVAMVVVAAAVLATLQQGFSSGSFAWTVLLEHTGIIFATASTFYTVIWEKVEPKLKHAL